MDVRCLLSTAVELRFLVAGCFCGSHDRWHAVGHVPRRMDIPPVVHSEVDRLSIYDCCCRVGRWPLARWLDRTSPSPGVCCQRCARAVCFPRAIATHSLVDREIQENTCI